NGKGSADAAHWLSMHNGEAMIVDRKTGQPRTIYVPSAAVSVCGGIQPGILKRVMNHEHRESGLLARLLFAMPPQRGKRWTDADIDPQTEQTLASIFDRLLSLQAKISVDRDPRPVLVPMTQAGRLAWKAFYDEHAREQADLSGDLSACWSKLEGYTARL